MYSVVIGSCGYSVFVQGIDTRDVENSNMQRNRTRTKIPCSQEVLMKETCRGGCLCRSEDFSERFDGW